MYAWQLLDFLGLPCMLIPLSFILLLILYLIKKNLYRDFVCQALLNNWSITVKIDMTPPHYNFKYDGDGRDSKKTHINGKF